MGIHPLEAAGKTPPHLLIRLHPQLQQQLIQHTHSHTHTLSLSLSLSLSHTHTQSDTLVNVPAGRNHEGRLGRKNQIVSDGHTCLMDV